MIRADQGPLLLIAAGVLLMVSLSAYLISTAEEQHRRIEASFERQTRDVQTRRSAEEIRALREENERMRRDRTSIHDRYAEILTSLKRIEEGLIKAPPPGPGR